jgi:hypothetical protein
MKQYLYVPFLLLISFSALAQESKKYLKYKDDPDYSQGYITDIQGKEIPGLIHIRRGNFTIAMIQLNGEKKSYGPSELKSYVASGTTYFSDGSSFFEFIRGGEKVWLFKKQIIVVGNQQFSPGFSEGEVFYVKKVAETKFTSVSKFNFKKKFSEYFSDCEDLVSKIENDGFGYNNIEEIVYFYNFQCGK